MPIWDLDEATYDTVCPVCGYRVTEAAAFDPATRARCAEGEDVTKVSLMLEWEHTEDAHPETITEH